MTQENSKMPDLKSGLLKDGFNALISGFRGDIKGASKYFTAPYMFPIVFFTSILFPALYVKKVGSDVIKNKAVGYNNEYKDFIFINVAYLLLCYGLIYFFSYIFDNYIVKNFLQTLPGAKNYIANPQIQLSINLIIFFNIFVIAFAILYIFISSVSLSVLLNRSHPILDAIKSILINIPSFGLILLITILFFNIFERYYASYVVYLMDSYYFAHKDVINFTPLILLLRIFILSGVMVALHKNILRIYSCIE